MEYQDYSHVRKVGNDFYYNKFVTSTVYVGGSCGGGGTEITELYKYSDGKETKVVDDYLSLVNSTSFEIVGSFVYYAKVNDYGMQNFSIVKAALDGSSKQVLQERVDNFWVVGNTFYFEKDNKIFSMNANGENVQHLSKITSELYTADGCGGGNYEVLPNGIANHEESYYYDFTMKTITALPLM